jgi:mannose-6-phosphate isomerase-like protein (cupin superfamily)
VQDKINLAAKLASFDETWVPKVVAELNGQQVKVAKLEGEFAWHSHAGEDELFWVLRGRLELELRDRTVVLGPGELFVVPRGVEHRPVARERVEAVLFEPATTCNTGESDDARRIDPADLERI